MIQVALFLGQCLFSGGEAAGVCSLLESLQDVVDIDGLVNTLMAHTADLILHKQRVTVQVGGGGSSSGCGSPAQAAGDRAGVWGGQ